MQQHSASDSVAKNIIAVHGLVFRYPNAASPCLDIAELIVQAGERIFLHGASGSGKSTLLSLLGGVLHAEHGVIRLLNHDLVTISSSQRDQLRANHMGFIFQQFNLIPYLSVIENVLLPCRFSSRRMQQALTKVAGGNLQEEAGRLLSQLDLSSTLWHTPVTQLSVGQQQRVAAARALIGSPDIVIADEPTSALDTDRQTAFIELLMRECTAANTTLLFVSHDRRLASMFHREISLPDINRANQMNKHPQ